MDISKILEQPLPLAPELIEGIVRCGHKMLISGPSKAGKSFALIALAIGIAEGKTWFGHQCKKGKVLYINLEIDPASFGDRVQRVYTALGWEPNHASNIRVWNLRGQSKPLDLLTPLLEALLKKNDFDLVIIDPIYKVITGDENNASDMGKFCNLFDRIARAGGCTVAYCHHHSKGSQAHKVAIDRASGSGVFGRDPDAIIDMTEIGLSEEERSELKARLMAKVDDAYLKASGQWENLARVHPEDLNNRLAKGLAVQEHLKLYPEKRETYEKRVAQADALGDCSAYRISYTLREFKSPNEQNLFFKYPIHVSDPSDFLKELYLVGDNSLEKLMNRKEKADRKRDDKKREWYEDERRKGEMVSISRFAKELDCGESTIRRWVDKQDDLKRGNGWIVWTDEEIPKESPKERAKATREEASQEKSQTLQESS